mmetsp:Transcript_26868/g.62222  ORF Transcript_26868/g.62222 Transcript_26868/m.62222 type:complete len:337 (-) Transcript_26868:1472-2482(-)
MLAGLHTLEKAVSTLSDHSPISSSPRLSTPRKTSPTPWMYSDLTPKRMWETASLERRPQNSSKFRADEMRKFMAPLKWMTWVRRVPVKRWTMWGQHSLSSSQKNVAMSSMEHFESTKSHASDSTSPCPSRLLFSNVPMVSEILPHIHSHAASCSGPHPSSFLPSTSSKLKRSASPMPGSISSVSPSLNVFVAWMIRNSSRSSGRHIMSTQVLINENKDNAADLDDLPLPLSEFVLGWTKVLSPLTVPNGARELDDAGRPAVLLTLLRSPVRIDLEVKVSSQGSTSNPFIGTCVAFKFRSSAVSISCENCADAAIILSITWPCFSPRIIACIIASFA